MLSIQNVTVRYGDKVIVNNLSFDLQPGQWLMLAGPNGAGKSTLINAIAQIAPYSGKIVLDNIDIRNIKPARLAQKIGFLSQKNPVGYAYTVEEVVEMGRYAYTSGFWGARNEGRIQIEEALQLTGLLPFRSASVLTLSGGELQRTFLAQVFAQDPQILILDEPANHLDLVYQKHIFSLIEQWLKGPNRAVLSVVHDLSLARKYGTHALLMHQGKSIAQGSIDDVFASENLNAVYQMDVYAWMRDMLRQWNNPADEK